MSAIKKSSYRIDCTYTLNYFRTVQNIATLTASLIPAIKSSKSAGVGHGGPFGTIQWHPTKRNIIVYNHRIQLNYKIALG